MSAIIRGDLDSGGRIIATAFDNVDGLQGDINELAERLSRISLLGKRIPMPPASTAADLPPYVADLLPFMPTMHDYLWVTNPLGIWEVAEIEPGTGVITWDEVLRVEIDVTGKMSLIASPTAGNIIIQDNQGNAVDGGIGLDILTDHSKMNSLSFEDSGHTGFSREIHRHDAEEVEFEDGQTLQYKFESGALGGGNGVIETDIPLIGDGTVTNPITVKLDPIAVNMAEITSDGLLVTESKVMRELPDGESILGWQKVGTWYRHFGSINDMQAVDRDAFLAKGLEESEDLTVKLTVSEAPNGVVTRFITIDIKDGEERFEATLASYVRYDVFRHEISNIRALIDALEGVEVRGPFAVVEDITGYPDNMPERTFFFVGTPPSLRQYMAIQGQLVDFGSTDVNLQGFVTTEQLDEAVKELKDKIDAGGAVPADVLTKGDLAAIVTAGDTRPVTGGAVHAAISAAIGQVLEGEF